VEVLAGAYQLSDPTGTEQYRFVDQIIVHPQYDDNTEENDIALLEVFLLQLHYFNLTA
jgi:secreted trypsin-like serine protease